MAHRSRYKKLVPIEKEKRKARPGAEAAQRGAGNYYLGREVAQRGAATGKLCVENQRRDG